MWPRPVLLEQQVVILAYTFVKQFNNLLILSCVNVWVATTYSDIQFGSATREYTTTDHQLKFSVLIFGLSELLFVSFRIPTPDIRVCARIVSQVHLISEYHPNAFNSQAFEFLLCEFKANISVFLVEWTLLAL